MNKARRKALADISNQMTTLISQLIDLKDELSNIKGEEEEYKDNMPESLQQSDKYYTAETAIEKMEEVINAIEELENIGVDGALEEAAA